MRTFDSYWARAVDTVNFLGGCQCQLGTPLLFNKVIKQLIV